MRGFPRSVAGASACFLLCAGAALGGGCAAQRPAPQADERLEYPAGEARLASDDLHAPASALVFDLPISAGQPPVFLDRQERQPSIFMGYEEPDAEVHTVVIDNVQASGGGDSCLNGAGCYGGGAALGDSYVRQDHIERTSVRIH